MMFRRSTITAFAMAGMIAVPALASDAQPGADENFRERFERDWAKFKEYSIEQKKAAVETGSDLIAAIDGRIKKLSADAEEATENAGVATEDEIEELKRVRDRIAANLEDAGEATASGWDSFKAAVGKAVDEVRETFAEDSKKAE